MEHHETYLSPTQPRVLATAARSSASDLRERRLQSRQGLRLRPSDILENAEPPSPLNASIRSPRPPSTKPAKMSLFNMFGRAKPERQRGFAEQGVDMSPDAVKEEKVQRTDLVMPMPQSDSPLQSPRRPPSVLSAKTTKTTKSTRLKSKMSSVPASPRERKPGPFEPPPLFQAYPQSTKEGVLEVSMVSPETLQKLKSRKGQALQAPDDESATEEGTPPDRSSTETKRTSALRSTQSTSALRHVANGSIAQVDLPSKIFVLITSGYLLQYSLTGPSDRLPEKMLHLGKDSAAFACDLLPGKHYVLQVAQAVDQEGVVVASTSSIFTRLGLRNAAAKRPTSNLLLVMPNVEEMESWMLAIRREIETLGGKKVRAAGIRPKTAANMDDRTDLKKTPSQSHRYQVRRDPSKESIEQAEPKVEIPTVETSRLKA